MSESMWRKGNRKNKVFEIFARYLYNFIAKNISRTDFTTADKF